MWDRDIAIGVEADLDDADYDISVTVGCPYCPRTFSGSRENVEEDLFVHLWKVHEEATLDYILNNMYIPDEIRERIFGEMGPEYVSWLVDTKGEVQEDQ